MEEKYLILNNASQFYIIIKCTARTVQDYINFGKSSTIKQDGSINIKQISNWLIQRNVSYRAKLGSTHNPILSFLIYEDVKYINKKAKRKNMLIPNEDLWNLLDELENGNFKNCWNFNRVKKWDIPK